jgi:thiamine pyrophosphate-dependent acetolactate synthase large subunit-like protein
LHPLDEDVATLRLTAGAALARTLAACGVRDVFGIAAGKLAPFLAAVGEDERLAHLGVRHEAAATWMAAATYAATGRIAVAYGESGPGSHNLVSALGSAYNNNLAALVITSGVPSELARPYEGMVMETDNLKLFSASTRWGAVARDAARVPALVHRALRAALTGRPGPVHLEVPADVLATEAEYSVAELDLPLERVLPARTAADPAAVARAAELLAGAQRPLVIAGGGVARAFAEDELRAVVAALGAAATSTQMGLGAISTEDPNFLGHGGVVGGDAVLRAFTEADVVLAVGCRFSSWLWDGRRPAIRGALVHIDVDPEIAGRAVPGSLGLTGDARLVLGQLRAALPAGTAAEPEWVAGLAAERAAWRAAYLAAADDGDAPLHPAVLADALGAALPPDALVTYDGAHTSFFSNDFTPATAPRTRFHEPGMGHLGFGIPYANALKAAFPDRPVVNITADGAFGFTLQELDTARRYGLNAVHVIHNNSAWGVIRLGQARAGFELGTGLEGTDHVAIARAFGFHAERVTVRAEIAPALERALGAGVPAVIDVTTRLVPHPGLPRFGAAGR